MQGRACGARFSVSAGPLGFQTEEEALNVLSLDPKSLGRLGEVSLGSRSGNAGKAPRPPDFRGFEEVGR